MSAYVGGHTIAMRVAYASLWREFVSYYGITQWILDEMAWIAKHGETP